MGTGQPPIPKTQMEIPKPPLTLLPPRGAYNVQLLWEPAVIKAGQVTHFGVVLYRCKNNYALNRLPMFKFTDQNDKVVVTLIIKMPRMESERLITRSNLQALDSTFKLLSKLLT